MVKKQNAKKSLSKKSGSLSVFWNKHWQVVLIGVLVFGILGFIGVNRLIIYNQKQQFDQAEKSLDTLYANIVKDVGQPASMNKDKSCTYASTEGGRGGRRCSVSLLLSYKDQQDVESAIKRAKATDLIIAKSSGDIFSSNAKLTHPSVQDNGSYYVIKSTESDGSSALDCEATYYSGADLSKTILNNEYFMIPASSSFITSISCYGDSLAEFYPVKN